MRRAISFMLMQQPAILLSACKKEDSFQKLWIKIAQYRSTSVVYLMLNPLYTYIINIWGWVWLGWVLWHINHSKLFNTKFSLYMYIKYMWVRWLVGWLVLWHINFCWLFNAKSIFMMIVLFQTIQFTISTRFKCKYSLIMKTISISSYSV